MHLTDELANSKNNYQSCSALYIGIINDIGRCIKAHAKGAGNRAIFEDDEIPPKLGCLSRIINRRNGKCFYE